MRVVLTRPAGDAQLWADGLQKAGHEVLLLPLIDIQPVSDLRPVQDAWAHLADYAALMFVSSNAVNFFMVQRPEQFLFMPFPTASLPRAWVTGPGSQHTLLHLGWPYDQIDVPMADAQQFDSPALWVQVQNQVRPGARVLLVRGESALQKAQMRAIPDGARASQWMVQQLRQAGAVVEFCQAYQRLAPVFTMQQQALARRALGFGAVWLFSSSEGIFNLRQGMPGLEFQKAQALTTHPRIARAAAAAGFKDVAVVRPMLAQVIASIESMA